MADDGVTRLLARINDGDSDAEPVLIELIEADFRRIARAQMRQERRAVTLNTTVLVNEAYMRLRGNGDVHWNSRRHYFAAAAEAMRRIRVEAARARQRVKRGGGASPISLEAAEELGAALWVDSIDEGELLGVDAYLAQLAAVHPRQAEVVKLRYFAGMSVDETAELLGVSPRTVDSDFRYARAWFSRALGTGQ